jgi:hypothetical protein
VLKRWMVCVVAAHSPQLPLPELDRQLCMVCVVAALSWPQLSLPELDRQLRESLIGLC